MTDQTFALLVALQTLGFIWIGLWLLQKDCPKKYIVICALAAVMGAIVSTAQGVPFWRNRPIVDGYDSAAIAWLFSCACIGFVRWLRIRAT